MKLQKFDASIPKKILTGMIVHDGILESIYNRLGERHKPFDQRWLDLVAKWCLEYYAKYKKAPKEAIVDRFKHYSNNGHTAEDNLDLIEKFLFNLGEDYVAIRKDLNEDYILDLAMDLFNKVQMRQMAEEITDALDENDLERADKARGGYNRIEAGTDNFIDPFSKDAILRTFRQLDEEEPLITFRGEALNQFLGPNMKRGDFVAFVGPEKRGKSFWLLETVYSALRSRRRVLYYAFGDMSESEVLKRLYIRAARRPKREMELALPKRIEFGEDGKLKNLITRKSEVYSRLTKHDVFEACENLLKLTACKEINLRMRVSSGYSVSAGSIHGYVRELVQRQAWMPDVIVIDYADLLDNEAGTSREEFRHRVNATWMMLRAIALDNHCLVVTATQAASAGYKNKWVLGKGDFSEDKRKNAHVTGMIGINQSAKEKPNGIYRLNWVALRDGHWSENQVLWTAGQLALSCPAIISAFSP